MTHKIISFAVLVMALSLFGCASEQYTQVYKEHPMRADTLKRMSQQDVINLSKAGVSDSLIVGMMDATDTWFQLKPQNVIDLKNAGVSENVISAMMEQPSAPQSNTTGERYYVYPQYYGYDGFYPYWYHPGFSIRLGFHGFHHHGRFH